MTPFLIEVFHNNTPSQLKKASYLSVVMRLYTEHASVPFPPNLFSFSKHTEVITSELEACRNFLIFADAFLDDLRTMESGMASDRTFETERKELLVLLKKMSTSVFEVLKNG